MLYQYISPNKSIQNLLGNRTIDGVRKYWCPNSKSNRTRVDESRSEGKQSLFTIKLRDELNSQDKKNVKESFLSLSKKEEGQSQIHEWTKKIMKTKCTHLDGFAEVSTFEA